MGNRDREEDPPVCLQVMAWVIRRKGLEGVKHPMPLFHIPSSKQTAEKALRSLYREKTRAFTTITYPKQLYAIQADQHKARFISLGRQNLNITFWSYLSVE